MDWAEMKKKRAAAIKGMQDILDNTEPLGLNVVLMFMLGLPVILVQTCFGTIRLIISCVLAMLVLIGRTIMAPFITLYLIVDVFLISLWYLKSISIKISED